MPTRTPITIAHGDGIGPEIMDATLSIIEAAGAQISPEAIEIGQRCYDRGYSAGIAPEAWESLRRTGVFLKGPITTPQGGGFKSLNVTIRKSMGMYANVRPSVSYAPFVATKHPSMDVVIVRENEEDLYAGIEHRQTEDVYQCLKLITRTGSEKIVRYAFEYAMANGRKKVTCFTKDNIMKMTDGLFHRVFDEVAAEYPDIASEHWIVDIGAAKLADTPEVFDVIVMPNLYGDILSDVAAQIAGSVGLAGSANIGAHGAMFEAIHGSAPPLAGLDVANPSGLFLASVMMLVHVGQADVATRAHNAWLRTIEDGVHTADIYSPQASKEKVGTKAFAQAVIARLGQLPVSLKPVLYESAQAYTPPVLKLHPTSTKQMLGVDVFLNVPEAMPEPLAVRLAELQTTGLKLTMITNRGVKVWPDGLPETYCTDHWRCRFFGSGEVDHSQVLELLGQVAAAGFDFIKTENLYTFDGEPGYSKGQGE